jgi:hypothetical protein
MRYYLGETNEREKLYPNKGIETEALLNKRVGKAWIHA